MSKERFQPRRTRGRFGASLAIAGSLAGIGGSATAATSAEVSSIAFEASTPTRLVSPLRAVNAGGVQFAETGFSGAVVITTPVKNNPPSKDIVSHNVKKGETMTEIAAQGITDVTDKKATQAQDDTVTAVDAVLSQKKDADKIKPGEKLFVTGEDATKQIIDALEGKGDPKLVADTKVLAQTVAKTADSHKRTDFDAKKVRDQAKVVIAELGLKIPDAAPVTKKETPKTVTEALGVTPQEMASTKTDKQLQTEVATAKGATIIVPQKLQETSIWKHQKSSVTNGYTSDAELNLTTRMADAATKFDAILNKDGKFDPQKMDKGDTFNQFRPEVNTVLEGISALKFNDMVALKEKLHHDVYVQIAKVWILNYRTSYTPKEVINEQDKAAFEVVLSMIEGWSANKGIPQQGKDVLEKLQAAHTRDAKRDAIMTAAPMSPNNFSTLFNKSSIPETPPVDDPEIKGSGGKGDAAPDEILPPTPIPSPTVSPSASMTPTMSSVSVNPTVSVAPNEKITPGDTKQEVNERFPWRKVWTGLGIVTGFVTFLGGVKIVRKRREENRIKKAIREANKTYKPEKPLIPPEVSQARKTLRDLTMNPFKEIFDKADDRNKGAKEFIVSDDKSLEQLQMMLQLTGFDTDNLINLTIDTYKARLKAGENVQLVAGVVETNPRKTKEFQVKIVENPISSAPNTNPSGLPVPPVRGKNVTHLSPQPVPEPDSLRTPAPIASTDGPQRRGVLRRLASILKRR